MMKRIAIAGTLLWLGTVAGSASARQVAGASAAAPAPSQTAPSPAAHAPVTFTPQYRPGESLRYQISFRSRTSRLTGGAVTNPQGARQLDLSVEITLRLEVLPPVDSTAPAVRSAQASPVPPSGERPPLRLRAVYERVVPAMSGDTYDPEANLLMAQYRRLQGRTIEFQLGPQGDVQYISGLREVLQDARALDEARNWLQQLGTGLSTPLLGTAPGQSWDHSEAVAGAPLAGTAVRTHSTYLRDEPCRAEDPGGEQCAVLLMRYTLDQNPQLRNSTPDEFRRDGLRTSGLWNSHGESLVHVSLRTGRTVSVSQSGDETMDLTIRHANGGPPFRYGWNTTTETHQLLLGEWLAR